jgi:hypothetical protein
LIIGILALIVSGLLFWLSNSGYIIAVFITTIFVYLIVIYQRIL